MTGDMVTINFYGDPLDAVPDGDKVWVSLRRACENLELDLSGQLKKLRAKAWACVEEKSTHDASGREQMTTMVDLDTLPMWLASIDPRKIKEEAREKLARYQKEATKVLADHFYGRKATGDVPVSLAAVLTRIVERLDRLEQRAAESAPVALPARTQNLPLWNIRDRCEKHKEWHHINTTQLNEIRRMANMRLLLNYGETPEKIGRVLYYWGHQTTVLDDAIDAIREKHRQREQNGPRTLWGSVSPN